MNEEMFVQSLNQQMSLKLLEQKEQVIKEAFMEAGLNMEAHINGITILYTQGDPFEHYYYKYGTSEERRIISIQRMPDVGWEECGRSITQKATRKYY